VFRVAKEEETMEDLWLVIPCKEREKRNGCVYQYYRRNAKTEYLHLRAHAPFIPILRKTH